MRRVTLGSCVLACLVTGASREAAAAPAAPLVQDGEVTALAYSPDGRLLAVGTSKSTIALWDMRRGAKLHMLAGTIGAVRALAFSPNGRMLASIGGSSDEKARLWDPATGQPLRTLSLFEIDGVSQGFTSLAFTPDSGTVVLGEGGGKVTLWGAAAGAHRRLAGPHDSLVTAVAATPDGATVLSADYERRVKIRALDAKAAGPESLGTVGEGFTGLAIAPDGSTIALGGSEKSRGRPLEAFPIEIWDLRTRKRLSTLPGHRAAASALAFAAGGRLVLSVAPDNTVDVWSVATGKMLLTTAGSTFAPSASSLAVGEGSAVKIVPLPKAP